MHPAYGVYFSTDFHISFESHPSRKPFPSANLNPTVSTLPRPFESLTSYPLQPLTTVLLCSLIVRAHLRLRIDALSPSAPNPISLSSTPYPLPLPVLPVARFSGSAAKRSPNSFPHNLLSDPHPLTPMVSIFYKNIGGRGASTRYRPGTSLTE